MMQKSMIHLDKRYPAPFSLLILKVTNKSRSLESNLQCVGTVHDTIATYHCVPNKEIGSANSDVNCAGVFSGRK